MGGGAGFIQSTPGVYLHGVEPAWYQAREHTLTLGLLHRLVLQERVVVFDEHLVQVKVSSSVTPVNFQVVVPSAVDCCGVLHL